MICSIFNDLQLPGGSVGHSIASMPWFAENTIKTQFPFFDIQKTKQSKTENFKFLCPLLSQQPNRE
jgi:hypothetical protein